MIVHKRLLHRGLPWLAVASILAVGAALSAQSPAPDPMFRAMHDEIDRSRKLIVSNLETPYFIEYLLDDGDSFVVTASLVGSRRDTVSDSAT